MKTDDYNKKMVPKKQKTYPRLKYRGPVGRSFRWEDTKHLTEYIVGVATNNKVYVSAVNSGPGRWHVNCFHKHHYYPYDYELTPNDALQYLVWFFDDPNKEEKCFIRAEQYYAREEALKRREFKART